MSLPERYVELRVGEHVEYGGRRIELVESNPYTAVLLSIDGQPVWLALGHRCHALVRHSADDLPNTIVTGGLRVGAEITSHYVGRNTYSDTHLGLTKDARLFVCEQEEFDAIRRGHEFPLRDWDWPYGDNWLTEVLYGYHVGQDLLAPMGTPAVMAAGGRVVDVRRFDPDKEAEDYWGNMVAVAAEDGFLYVYCHTSEIDAAIRTGARVEAGQRLGPVGKSGFAGQPIRPHLHFEMLVCRRPEEFRFAFDSESRILSAEAEGFVVNPRQYLCLWHP